jgi:uncharacterized protein (DUF924 family)
MQAMSDPRAAEILKFWFAGGLAVARSRWFVHDPAVDAEIARRFAGDIQQAASGQLDHWKSDPTGVLALVVLLDQFPRYCYRDTAKAYENDDRARDIALGAIAAELDNKLDPVARGVLYTPLMHAEDREAQRESVATFKMLADGAAWSGAGPEVISHLRSITYFATRNAAVIERFGRFPMRNLALGRASTEAELEFLAEPTTLRESTW